jgi:hypothetical protein
MAKLRCKPRHRHHRSLRAARTDQNRARRHAIAATLLAWPCWRRLAIGAPSRTVSFAIWWRAVSTHTTTSHARNMWQCCATTGDSHPEYRGTVARRAGAPSISSRVRSCTHPCVNNITRPHLLSIPCSHETDNVYLCVADGWYLVDPPEDHCLRRQPLDGIAECSWSGQSGREKRDEQIKSLLVRDIGVVTTATQRGYAKRAKIYTFDPEAGTASEVEERYRGVKLLCVHDKRRYTRKAGDSPVSQRAGSQQRHAESPRTTAMAAASSSRGTNVSIQTPPRANPRTPKVPSRRADMSLHPLESEATLLESELGKMLMSMVHQQRPRDADEMSEFHHHKRQRSSTIRDVVKTHPSGDQFTAGIRSVNLCL